MYEVFKIFILSSIVVTFWTAFLLFQDKRGVKLLNRWFAVFLLALTAPQMDLYAMLVIPGGIFELTIAASTFLWLKGPFIWVFLAVLTRAQIRTIWIHFVPWLLVLITLFIVPQNTGTFMLLGMGHMLVYLLLALARLVNKRSYIGDLWQGFQNTAYYWLLYVIVGLMVLVAIDFVVMSLVQRGILKTYNFLDYYAFPIFSVYVLSVGVLCVYRPELLFRAEFESATSDETCTHEINANENHVDDIGIQSTPEQVAPGNIHVEQIIDQRERYLELDPAIAQSLMQQLKQFMQEQQIYRQNELALPDLANALGISVHQVSELLNVHQGVSFYEYLNTYRLKYACELLNNPKCHLRILDIAFESGFNNKNSFYRIFKENIGVTPNQYRAEASALKTKAVEVFNPV